MLALHWRVADASPSTARHVKQATEFIGEELAAGMPEVSLAAPARREVRTDGDVLEDGTMKDIPQEHERQVASAARNIGHFSCFQDPMMD